MKHLLALVGMPGSGKSVAGNFFKQKGIRVLRFGDVTDEGLKAQGLELTQENERPFRENLRKEFGMAAYAMKMEPKIREALEQVDTVVLDGMYSWEEYEYLKERFPFLQVMSIFASPEVRYERLRSRDVRPLTGEEAQRRDIAEIAKLNKGGPIAMADYMIQNEGTEEDLEQKLANWLQTIS